MVRAFLKGWIVFLTTFLMDFRADLPLKAVLDTMEAGGEGKGGNESGEEEREKFEARREVVGSLRMATGRNKSKKLLVSIELGFIIPVRG
jgi:hypothetical protein